MKITSKEEYQTIAEHLQPLFTMVDHSILNISYQQIGSKDLFRFSYQDKDRYIDVSGLDPFKVLNSAVCTLDHYNLNYLFLNDKKVNELFRKENEEEMELT